MNIKWEKVSKRELKSLLIGYGHKSHNYGAFHISSDGINHTIYLPPHTSTRTRLHELGHAMNGHCNLDLHDTWGDVARKEVEAEAYRYSKTGKSYDFLLAYSSIWILVYDAGCRPGVVFRWAMKCLSKYMVISWKDKSLLWSYIIDFYKGYRRQKKEGTLSC